MEPLLFPALLGTTFEKRLRMDLLIEYLQHVKSHAKHH